tara:strand:+ start:225 stop:380 length:156 start_codon:yes stop_codon:yes gene_type:complete
MTTYKFQKGSRGTHNVAVLKDNKTSIPIDEANTDYQEYLEWAKTNTTEPAD